MAYDDDDKSISSSAPIELYTFTTPTLVYRLTTYHKDIVFGGNTFVASPASRSNISVTDVVDDDDALTIEIPATHALAQHYANGIPPREVLVTLQRYQSVSGTAISLWDGHISSVAFRDRMASFRVPSTIGDALARDCPGVLATRWCNHVLYDARCGVNPASFRLTTTIAAISTDGRTITLNAATSGAVDGVPWAKFGYILHDSTGERRTIAEMTSTTVMELHVEFPRQSLTVGDAVTIQAGCNRAVSQCKLKYNNVPNFGGHWQLPESNPFYISLSTVK